MASWLYFFDPVRQQIQEVVSTPLAGVITGVWFDGFYYWVCDDTSDVKQLHLTQSGTLIDVTTFNISSTAPDFLDYPTGLCGDDTYLYINYQYDDGGGNKGFVIGQWTRDGTYITALEGTRLDSSDLTVDRRKDLTTNGKNIAYTTEESRGGGFYGFRVHSIAESENCILLDTDGLTIGGEYIDGIAYAGGHQLFIGYGTKGKIAKINDALDVVLDQDLGQAGTTLAAIDFGSSTLYSKHHARTYQHVMSNFDDGRIVVIALNI